MRLYVSPIEIIEQREKDWPSFHPEAYCHKCGQRNVWSWFVPSELWNEVMKDEKESIVCPQCFTELAEEKRVGTGVWKLEPS